MRYTVIGLGQFGQELGTELSARNIEVVAGASTDEELEQINDLVTYAVVTDYTNPAACLLYTSPSGVRTTAWPLMM